MLLRVFCTAFLMGSLVGCDSGASFAGVAVLPARPAPELAGTNWDGEVFSLNQAKGGAVVVFFGYTFCPDICPATFSQLRRVREQLGDSMSANVRFVFVTVDPERDTTKKLGQYVGAFGEGFVGLRFEGRAMAQVLQDFDIRVTKHSPQVGGGYYAVDHTGTLFVIDLEGQLRVTHLHDFSVDALASDLRRLLSE